MAELVVQTRLEDEGVLLMNDRLRALIVGLEAGLPLGHATAQAGLSSSAVGRWRGQVRSRRGEDPLDRSGSRLRASTLGAALLEEFEHRKAAHEAHEVPKLQAPLLAVDGIVLLDGKLVAIERRYDPFRGQVAIPGGLVEYGESLEEAVVREVREETGLETRVVSLVGVYSRPDRDPRGHVISVVYALEPTGGTLSTGSDAAGVAQLGLDTLPEMAFDHEQIIADFRAQSSG
ncbi:MAG: NUDIX domain-containing protein [Thermoplasmata archaeon]